MTTRNFGGDTLLLRLLLEEQMTWNIPLFICFLSVICIYGISFKQNSMKNMLSLQPLLFLTGLTLLYFMIGSPLTAISHLSFSFHMIQMSMLYFIIPPLLLLGIPEWMFFQIKSHLKLRKMSHNCISPKIALYIFSLLFLMYHLPIVLQFLSQHAAFQFGYISTLFILSISMWWPIASPDVKRRLRKDDKKRYAFISGLFITPACVLFILTALLDGASNPFIAQLTVHLCLPAESGTMNILPPPFNTKYDQIMAGISMMGLHKLGLMMAFKLENTLFNHHLELLPQSSSIFYSTKKSTS